MNNIKNESQIQTIGYLGRVKVTIKGKNKNTPPIKIKSHNDGMESLFTFLYNCLCRDLRPNDCPMNIFLLYGGSEGSPDYISSQYTMVGSSNVIKREIDGKNVNVLVYKAIFSPKRNYSGNDVVRGIAMYSSNNTGHVTEASGTDIVWSGESGVKDYSSMFTLFDGSVSLTTSMNLLIEWELQFINPVVESSQNS